jgi:hypothetical protein
MLMMIGCIARWLVIASLLFVPSLVSDYIGLPAEKFANDLQFEEYLLLDYYSEYSEYSITVFIIYCLLQLQ